MTNAAILVGNAMYRNQPRLECCSNDLIAMKQLIEATDRYSVIKPIENADADELKSSLREVLEQNDKFDEIFFYFTGHGIQIRADFFFCSVDFDEDRPNETGLSNSELHDLLRGVSPELCVKIIDACNSGTRLIKRDRAHVSADEPGFKNIIQIASCLEDQESLTGQPLSEFTQSFCKATLRKQDGPVYYTDIMNIIRDEYLHDIQAPHFVSQVTGREIFIDNAAHLKDFRDKFLVSWVRKEPCNEAGEREEEEDRPSAIEILEQEEKRLATPEKIELFIGKLFQRIQLRLNEEIEGNVFQLNIEERSGFEEGPSKRFIIEVLNKQDRPDKFVLVDFDGIKKNSDGSMDPSSIANSLLVSNPSLRSSLLFGDEVYDGWRLELNCNVHRIQLKVSLVPLYKSLKKIVLVVTCAPSLEDCYIFEFATQHALVDFDRYHHEGDILVRKWYMKRWSEEPTQLADHIARRLYDVAEEVIEKSAARFGGER